VKVIGEVLGRQIRFEELSPDEFRRDTADSWPGPVVEMLLDAWGATVGRPAYVTSTVADILGGPALTFRQWVSDHADVFRDPPPG
jgi:cobalamin biosynthesis protein CobT